MMTYLWNFLNFVYRTICRKSDKQTATLNAAFDETNTGYIVCDV